VLVVVVVASVDGVVVVVVVVAGVVAAAVTSRRAAVPALSPGAMDDPPVAEVVGVPSRGAMARVVVVVGGEVGCVTVFLRWPAGVVAASRRCPRGPGCWEATAATKARSERATARTAHQCGRIRAGPETPGPDLVTSPPTA